MPFVFDTVIDRRNTASVKHDTVEANGYPADVLPMWVADMDFQVPPCVTEALGKAVDHGIFGYSFPTDGYFSAIQSWFQKHFAWQIQKDWIQPAPGVVFALATAIRAMTQPGDGVLVTPPVYYPFYRVIQINDRKLVESQLKYEDGKYTIDFADFEKKIREEEVKLFILCSPHNPICRVWTEDELKTIGQICRRHGVKVISDEIHCDFTWPGITHIPFVVACPEMAEHTMVCTAPSKSFNLAGLQTSNIIIPGAALREKWQEEMQRLNYQAPNSLGLLACQAAYEGGEQWLQECKEYMKGNLDYVRSFLEENLPQIQLVQPEGTYFAWLDCSGLGLTKEALDQLIIHKAKLWLDTGSLFGQCAGQFQRVVLACPRQLVEKAMRQIKMALEE